MKKAELLSMLNAPNEAGGDFYSKEKVIEMIEKLELEKMGSDDFDALSQSLYGAIEGSFEKLARDGEIVEYDTASFDLNGDRITLEDVQVEIGNLTDNTMAAIRNFFF